MIFGNQNFNKNDTESEMKDNDFEEINQEISKALIDMKIENINEKKKIMKIHLIFQISMI